MSENIADAKPEEAVETLDGLLTGDEGKDTPTESQPETKPEETEETEEKKTEGAEESEEGNKPPFDLHKHPRFKKVLEERNELREEVDSLKEPKEEKQVESGQFDEPIDPTFARLYGDDPDLWRLYKQQQDRDRASLKAELKEEFREEQESVAQRQKESEQRARERIQEDIQDLHDAGRTFDDNKLMKFMEDYPIWKDGSDELDFEKGLDLLEKTERGSKEKSDARKKVISDSGSDSSADEGGGSKVPTLDEVHKKGW